VIPIHFVDDSSLNRIDSWRVVEVWPESAS
jgi:hypothetical protein